jgi:hypothetical protein
MSAPRSESEGAVTDDAALVAGRVAGIAQRDQFRL